MKSFKKTFKSDRFEQRREFGFKRQERRIVGTIIDLKDRDYYKGNVKIMRKTQPGPVIFTISDGYGSVDAVIKDSEFNVDDVVEVSGEVNERAGKLQVEIDRIEKSKFDFNPVIEQNSEPINKEFSIQSDRFEKLRPYFYKIAKRIRKAVLENQSIMIRHHSDSDGINAGMAIEHSCRMLMEKIGVNPDYNLYRSPSRAPFYDISDVFRDVVLTKRIIEGHGQKKPLIIVLDNGSTPEDVFGVKTLKSLGFEIIVIDHHNPVVIENKKTLVDPYISLHLNPYIEGLDSKTCAAMLAYETGRWICEDYSNPALPAVAGISDRCDIKETEEYIKKSGKERKELEEIGTAIDFISYHLKFDAGKGLFEELYKNSEFVKIINEEVRKGVETQLESTLPYLRTQDINGVILSTIDLEKYTMKFKYPAPGKVVGMIHDTVIVGKENTPVITLGYLSDMIIVRATKPVLPVTKMMKRIKKDLPHSHVEGGGHECAGAIKFTSAHLNDILENIKQQVKELNYLNSLGKE
jgi:RecJ-like exonuclease